MISKCKCGDFRSDGAAFQNERYGYGNRVFNPCGGKSRGKYHCTVCGEAKDIGTAKADKAAAPKTAK